jgi:CDP-glycerol glycerophosphotransferase
MSSLKNKIGRNAVILLYHAFRIFPIKQKKIFVSNFFGKGYGDSPKYIVDYLRKHYLGYDIVWVVKDNYEFPNGIRTVNIQNLWGTR